MTTTCCNVKVKYIRPGYQNLKEWCEDPRNVYIGRKGVVFIDGQRFPKRDSIWANPFKITATETRESVIEQYRVHMIARLLVEPELNNQLEALRGKNLGCFCHPEACHGDILLALLEKK